MCWDSNWAWHYIWNNETDKCVYLQDFPSKKSSGEPKRSLKTLPNPEKNELIMFPIKSCNRFVAREVQRKIQPYLSLLQHKIIRIIIMIRIPCLCLILKRIKHILNWINTMLVCQNVVSMQIKSFLLNKINKFGWVFL